MRLALPIHFWACAWLIFSTALAADSTGRIRIPKDQESQVPINLSATLTVDNNSTCSASITYHTAKLFTRADGVFYVSLYGVACSGANVDFLISGACYSDDGSIIEVASEVAHIRGNCEVIPNGQTVASLEFTHCSAINVPAWFEVSINARGLHPEEIEDEKEEELFNQLVERPRPGLLVIKLESHHKLGEVIWESDQVGRIFLDEYEGTDSFEYRYAGRLGFIPYHKVRYIDGRSYERLILVHRAEGTLLPIEGEPLRSPDKSRFVTFSHSVFRQAMEIWNVEHAHPTRECRVDFADLRIGLCAFDCRWEGNDAVLFNWKEPDGPLWDQPNQRKAELDALPGALLLQSEGWTLLDPPILD